MKFPIKKSIFLLILTFLFLQTTSSFSQDYKTKLENYLQQRYERGEFMGTVLVAKNGIPVFKKSYGFANIEKHSHNNPNLKYLIGSMTKQFTAALILKLEEMNLLSINDKLSKYYPSYKNGDKITVRNLLNHTSGIPNYTSDDSVMKNLISYKSIAEILDTMFTRELEFKPDSVMKYSNTGFLILGDIIEKASGKIYKEFIQETIFTPLAMNNSAFNVFDTTDIMSASGYTLDEDKKIVRGEYMDVKYAGAAGSISSTVDDMLKWDMALYSNKILSEKSRQEMFTPGMNNYGYGIIIDEPKYDSVKHKRIWHAGRIPGFTSVIQRFIEDTTSVIVLCNNDMTDLNEIRPEITRIVFGEDVEIKDKPVKVEIAVDPAIYEQYTGVYELAPDFSIEITTAEGKIFGQATGQGKFEMFPSSETKFFLKIVEADIEFLKDDAGNVTKMILFQNGAEMPGIKK
jgi:CubicO group peptidase (beta-lactamase class C family)